jgi:hypothetical protein
MIEKKFALFPTRMTSGRLVWLKHYNLHRSLYDESTGKPPINSMYFEFTETEAEATWRILKESVVHNRNIWNTHELTKRDSNRG